MVLPAVPYPSFRSTTRGDPKYYIREIKNLFVVGQTYPVTEVPGPHSRKITTTIKNRLQIIAFKLLQKSAEQRLKISRLMKYFPDQNELQMRQRLKVKCSIGLKI
jgi:transcription initiation factor TFIID subunit 1, fungi type